MPSLLEDELELARDSARQVAAGVAHDLNNILGVIMTAAGLVAEDLGDGSPLLEDVAEIQHAAERAAALTRRLMAFGRRRPGDLGPLDLNRAVLSYEPELRAALGDQIKLETRLCPELWPATGDRAQVEEVLAQLAANARDAMPDRGQLTIETDNAETGDRVRLSVTDTGAGMEPEVWQRAFEPFFTTKPRSVSPGLGLPTVLGIVTDAGGSVQVRSEPGSGTTVEVLLVSARAA